MRTEARSHVTPIAAHLHSEGPVFRCHVSTFLCLPIEETLQLVSLSLQSCHLLGASCPTPLSHQYRLHREREEGGREGGGGGGRGGGGGEREEGGRREEGEEGGGGGRREGGRIK